ncbi:MAG: rhodanese-like domain-containing protein [Planctomycetota bacterium]|nr:MAG: rhodanese-like domain-containing protein [Planctomycetota bacterium]REK43479.1 MAG: rhodanese-like domain-containing protein [Planctomycetota bacterium]
MTSCRKQEQQKKNKEKKMYRRILVSALLVGALPCQTMWAADEGNPNIDYEAFAKGVVEVGRLRAARRISEERFIEMAADPETVVLDARSKEKFDLLHVKGAVHLSLPDMTEAELARVIPEKTTRVLIYCNNNFERAPVAFPTKRVGASLNVHTFNVLHQYGYRNVYELKPLLDIDKTKIPFAGSRAGQRDEM